MSDLLADHDAKSYAERRRIEIAICAFVAAKAKCEPRKVSMDGVRWFILWSSDYLPLLAALAALPTAPDGADEGAG